MGSVFHVHLDFKLATMEVVDAHTSFSEALSIMDQAKRLGLRTCAEVLTSCAIEWQARSGSSLFTCEETGTMYGLGGDFQFFRCFGCNSTFRTSEITEHVNMHRCKHDHYCAICSMCVSDPVEHARSQPHLAAMSAYTVPEPVCALHGTLARDCHEGEKKPVMQRCQLSPDMVTGFFPLITTRQIATKKETVARFAFARAVPEATERDYRNTRYSPAAWALLSLFRDKECEEDGPQTLERDDPLGFVHVARLCGHVCPAVGGGVRWYGRALNRQVQVEAHDLIALRAAVNRWLASRHLVIRF